MSDGHHQDRDEDHSMNGNDDGAVAVVSECPAPLYSQVARFRQQKAPARRRGAYGNNNPPNQHSQQRKVLKHVSERYVRQDLGFGFHYPTKNLRPAGIESADELVQLLLSSAPQPQPSENRDAEEGGPEEEGDGSGSDIPATEIVVVDTNVLLHNMDVLEQTSGLIPLNVVVPQTALEEARRHSLVAYERAVALLRRLQAKKNPAAAAKSQQQQKKTDSPPVGLGIFFPDGHHFETTTTAEAMDENDRIHNNNDNSKAATSRTPNDVNDAQIRNVAAFFARNVPADVSVVYLSDDSASRSLLKREARGLLLSNCHALSVREWVQRLEERRPGLSLSDWVAQLDSAAAPGAVRGEDKDASGPAKASRSRGTPEETPREIYEPHLDADALMRGVQSGAYHRGVVRCSATPLRIGDDNNDDGGSTDHDSASAWVTIRRGEERVAVTIRGMADRNRAVDGDVVAIAVHPLERWINAQPLGEKAAGAAGPEAAGIAGETAPPALADMENVQDKFSVQAQTVRPTGRVVGILRRNFPPALIGSLGSQAAEKRIVAAQFEREHDDGSSTCVFFPVDGGRHPPVLIRTLQRERLLTQRVVVAMDSWPANSPYPLGHYVRSLGEAGAKDVETQVLLEQHNIPYEPFPASVLACLPSEDYRIAYTPDRTDLRKLPVLSIDPPNCKDIDDALHCVALPNGNLQVGVHIADVTHYVKAGSAMDLEAANRSTSTYLVNQRLDMLPGLLTTDLCSLKSNVDRYAFSVLWEVTPEAEIVKVDFCKSMIHSIAALTYQQAQSMIEQPSDSKDVQACAVKRLASLARLFRQRRIQAGALTLASPEVKFVLDSESLNPTDVQAYALLEANALVEEFMLLANVTVAKKILRHYPTLSVLRRHPSPNRAMFDGLISKAKCRGYELDIDDSKRLADSLDAAVDPSDPYINKLLRILSTRCMSPAQYFCSGEVKAHDWHHYGLAAPVYTHFTSPIRRYADVCVHRLLAASIGVSPLPTQFTKSNLHDLCANMNRRHRSAQLAGRASVQLHTLIYFAGDDGAKEEDAYVLDVSSSTSNDLYLTVIVPRYGIEGKVHLPVQADDPQLQFIPDQHKISFSNGSAGIQVFDKVRVRIWVREFEDHQRELVVDLISPTIGGDGNARNKRPIPNDELDAPQNKKTKSV